MAEIETKKFVKNVLENIKRKDWFHIVSLVLTVLLVLSNVFYFFSVNYLKKSGEMAVSVAQAAQTQRIEKKVIFLDKISLLPKISVASIGDDGFNFRTEFYYETDWESHREILDGFFRNAGWVSIYGGQNLFFIAREQGRYIHPMAFYFFDEKDRIFKKIKFKDLDGQTREDVESLSEIPSGYEGILKVWQYDPDLQKTKIKKYKYYGYPEYLFTEI